MMGAGTTNDVLAEIRAWMGRRNVSQTDLGRALGVAPSWASKRLSGSVELSVSDLIAIAAVLDVSPMAFFDPPATRTELRPTRYSGIPQGTAVPGSVRRARVAA